MNSSLSPICWLKLSLVRLLRRGCGWILQQILGDQSGLKGKHDHHSICMRSDSVTQQLQVHQELCDTIMLICAEKCTINVLKDTINLGNISSVNVILCISFHILLFSIATVLNQRTFVTFTSKKMYSPGTSILVSMTRLICCLGPNPAGKGPGFPS